MDINQEEYLGKFKVIKGAERKRLIALLSETTGWNKRAIHFSTVKWPDSWLQDALNDCESYSNEKLRNKRFGDFIKQTKQ